MSKAYREGRSETDPADNWYKGEIGFLDFYVIPLALKLKECGVFGVSSDEYLNYAQRNRKEWEDKGEAVVAEMVEALKKEWKEEEEAQALKEQFVESHDEDEDDGDASANGENSSEDRLEI